MQESKQNHARTVLEYLVMIHDKSYSGIGRELNITPQQFSDWIKKRRPIPAERLELLTAYFGVDRSLLVDEHFFARPLTPLFKIDIHMLLIDHKLAELSQTKALGELEPYQLKKQQLLRERTNELRLGRLAAVLDRDDPEIDAAVDLVLNVLDAGGAAKLFAFFRKGENEA